MTSVSFSSERHSLRSNCVLVAEQEAEQVVERSGGAHVALADRGREAAELRGARREVQLGAVDRDRLGQRGRAEQDLREVDRAACGDAVVASRIDVRHARPHRDVGCDDAGELADVLELHGPGDVGEIH
jgi:hypothetical protein